MRTLQSAPATPRFIQEVPPKHSFDDLVLPQDVSEAIGELLEDQVFRVALLKNRIPVRRRVLLHGPPGCGKTSIAHALSLALKIKLFQVSMSDTIQSHMGETSSNLATAVSFAAQNECVLIMDEFDSVGEARGSAGGAADKERNNAVNTLLTNLESKQPLGLIVACTNLLESLDKALIRRFDLVLEVPAPAREALLELAGSILGGRFGLRPESGVGDATTPAAVTGRCWNMLRRAVIEEEKAKAAYRASDGLAKKKAAQEQIAMSLGSGSGAQA